MQVTQEASDQDQDQKQDQYQDQDNDWDQVTSSSRWRMVVDDKRCEQPQSLEPDHEFYI